MPEKEIVDISKGGLDAFFDNWDPKTERLVIGSPHDDDAAAVAMLAQQAMREGAQVFVLIATDGSEGATRDNMDTIVTDRFHESFDAYHGALGIPEENIIHLGYPDGGLQQYLGKEVTDRRLRELWGGKHYEDFYAPVHGRFGITKKYGATHVLIKVLRSIAATRVFLPDNNDYNTDHVALHSELHSAARQAGESTFPLYGDPNNVDMKGIYTYFGWNDPPEDAQSLKFPEGLLERKVSTIEMFQSQAAIIPRWRAKILDRGPVEPLKVLYSR